MLPRTIRRSCLVLMAVLIIGWQIAGIQQATAASLSVSPKTAEYKVGSTFKLSIYASSPDQALNTVAGSLTFPPTLLEVTSLSKEGSVFGLWIREPSFSNTAGNVAFESVVLNPGYIGNGGKVLTVNFKVKAAGTAALGISGASILANDGLGTNILTGVSGASLSLIAADATPPPAPTDPNAGSKVDQPVVVDPKAPAPAAITSSTHADSNAWYQSTSATFSWNLPADATGVSYLVDEQPTTNPKELSLGLVRSASVDNITDGVHYFHLRISNKAGWSATSHFRFQVDTTPPTSSASLEPPVFIDYPTTLKVGDLLKITGNSYPNTKVTLYVQDPDGNVTDDYVKTDAQGDFTMVWSKGLAHGAYRYWAITQQSDGAKSPETDRVTVVVTDMQLAQATIFGLNALLLLMIMLGMILLLLVIIWYLNHHFRHYHQAAEARSTSVKPAVDNRTIRQWQEHMKEELTTLERAKAKRPLTKEEEQVLAQLIKDLASD